ncbi:hypothetical protein GCM10009734_27820 [Nonomuraea bangladeshensis]
MVTPAGQAYPPPVSDRQFYRRDLSDERWALIEPVITAWKARHGSIGGHQGNYDMREIVNTCHPHRRGEVLLAQHEGAVACPSGVETAACTLDVTEVLVGPAAYGVDSGA